MEHHHQDEDEETTRNDSTTASISTTACSLVADEETGFMSSSVSSSSPTEETTLLSSFPIKEDDEEEEEAGLFFDDEEVDEQEGEISIPLGGGGGGGASQNNHSNILKKNKINPTPVASASSTNTTSTSSTSASSTTTTTLLAKDSIRDSILRSLSFGSTRHDSFIDASLAMARSFGGGGASVGGTSCNDSVTSYDTFSDTILGGPWGQSIRFQVVIWYVGRPDEVLSKVEMKFRVTIFWNSPNPEEKDKRIGYGMNNPFHNKVWKMHGRQRAYQSAITEVGKNDKIVYVPPVTILNSSDYEVEGEPEVCLLNTEENLMKWSCVYKASLLQDNMQVSEFPHDCHDLVLRLGILKHRQSGKRWDKNRWRLALATFDDTQETICTPHGTIVEHVIVPGFSYTDELQFQLVPFSLGMEHGGKKGRDHCLEVKLNVKRESSYFDRNIIPLLAALNIVAVSTLALHPDKFGARGQCILATSFVEIGIRMTVDSHLPVVGYQIKIQWVLNNFFFGLLFLVITSSIAYVSYQHGLEKQAMNVDRFAAICELLHIVVTVFVYCIGSGNTLDRIIHGTVRNNLRYENL